jgi:hypothetical protein
MKSIYKQMVVIGSAFLLSACAGLQPTPAPTSKGQPEQSSQPISPRQVIIFIPQTDQSAPAWLKLFDKYPQLRMVIAVSPRFNRFAKEPPLKEKVLALISAGRLELALQLPNAPFLPLLINTDLARTALPAGAPLPSPPFMHPEDVTQVVAKAKVDLTTAWGINPKGFVLPQGAVNADLLKQLNQLGLGWVVGALGAPKNEGAYRSGNLAVWDATPVQENPRFMVQVWDERLTGNSGQSLQTLNTWAQELVKNNLKATLPSDEGIPLQDLPADAPWGGRTWTTKDWSPWIGSAHKNAAWSWLRNTRDALENFKNSGRASVRRLDMAFEEIYNAENANYFSGITEGETTFTLAEDREREFKATLSSVYRLIGQAPPDNLFSAEGAISVPGFRGSSTTLKWETFPDGGRLTIEDAMKDDNGDGQLKDPLGTQAPLGVYDLRRVEVRVSTESLDWTIMLGSINGGLGNFQIPGPLIDIYVDLNGQPGVGTLPFLPGRGVSAASSDAWEYAFSLWGSQVQFYRTRGPDTYDLSDTVPLTIEGNRIKFSVPRAWLRGNPQRWGYQVAVMSYDPKSLESDVRPLITPDAVVARRVPIYDLIDPLDMLQAQVLTDIEQGKRNDLSFVRLEGTR